MVAKVSDDKRLVFDAKGFGKELEAARDATKPSPTEDAAHLARIERWVFALGVAGILLSVRGVISPLAMLALGYYKYAKFAILAHHSLHGGYGVNRRGWYAQGLVRRVVDWLDWIFPAAWIAEHNKVHHYKLNEDADPDFVERNTEFIRDLNLPKPIAYLVVAFNAATWKWFYYTSNTMKLVHADRPNAPAKEEFEQAITLSGLIGEAIKGSPWHRALAADLFFRVMGPPLLLHFFAFPVITGFLRGNALPFCAYTFANMVGAELVTNVHAFCTIVTNHAGGDLWHFDCGCKADSPEFYVRAVLGSTAYHAGTDLIDFWHGYLNYQGEHHAFPALSALHYQRLHPHFKRVCAAHGVPYIQEPVWVRTKKTADVIIGNAKHMRLSGMAIDHPERWMMKQ